MLTSDAPKASDFHRRNPYVVVLLAVGALAAIVGVISALTADASANTSAKTVLSGPLPTLPVHTYAQYTNSQHFIVHDYTGLWIGALVAVIGGIILLAGVVVAFTKPRLS